MKNTAVFAPLLLLLSIAFGCQPRSSAPPAAASQPVPQLGDTVADFGPSAMAIFHAANGDIWVGSDDRGVYRYDGKVILRYDTAHGLAGLQVREIQEDQGGSLYFATPQGISRWDGRTFATLPTHLRMSESEPWTSGPDDLWFKGGDTHGGPIRWDGAWLHDMRFPKHPMEDAYYQEYPNSTWSPYDIYSIYTDRQGTVWFGTSHFGVCRWDGQDLAWLYEDHLQYTPQGGSFGLRSVLQDRAGDYWICNTRYRYRIAAAAGEERDGTRLLRYERLPGITGFKALDGQDQVYFLSAVEDKQGRIWMACFKDGVWRYDGKEMVHFPVQDGGSDITTYCITLDRSGNPWVGTHNGGPFRWDGKGFVRFRG